MISYREPSYFEQVYFEGGFGGVRPNIVNVSPVGGRVTREAFYVGDTICVDPAGKNPVEGCPNKDGRRSAQDIMSEAVSHSTTKVDSLKQLVG